MSRITSFIITIAHVVTTTTSIAKTASRNVVFKARRLRESIMEGQDSFIIREPEDAEVEFGEDGEDVVADAGNNAARFICSQSGEYRIDQ